MNENDERRKKVVLLRLIGALLFAIGLASMLTVSQVFSETPQPVASLGSFLVGALGSIAALAAGIGIFLLSFRRAP